MGMLLQQATLVLQLGKLEVMCLLALTTSYEKLELDYFLSACVCRWGVKNCERCPQQEDA